jgi:hypothetical protein
VARANGLAPVWVDRRARAADNREVANATRCSSGIRHGARRLPVQREIRSLRESPGLRAHHRRLALGDRRRGMLSARRVACRILRRRSRLPVRDVHVVRIGYPERGRAPSIAALAPRVVGRACSRRSISELARQRETERPKEATPRRGAWRGCGRG